MMGFDTYDSKTHDRLFRMTELLAKMNEQLTSIAALLKQIEYNTLTPEKREQRDEMNRMEMRNRMGRY